MKSEGHAPVPAPAGHGKRQHRVFSPLSQYVARKHPCAATERGLALGKPAKSACSAAVMGAEGACWRFALCLDLIFGMSEGLCH